MLDISIVPAMNYVIVPNQGVDDLRFGMTPAQVRAIAGDDFVPSSGRAESKEFPIDHYYDLGMFCVMTRRVS